MKHEIRKSNRSGTSARFALYLVEIADESYRVTMCLVRNGVDRKVFERGLAEWRKRNGK